MTLLLLTFILDDPVGQATALLETIVYGIFLVVEQSIDLVELWLSSKFPTLAFVENSADILFKVVWKKLAIQFLKRTTLEWIKHFFSFTRLTTGNS